jgi:hypothetical protein
LTIARQRTRVRIRPAFSIIETVLAIVVGAMVLLGCVSIFLATGRAERAFAERFERTGELWTTQLAVRRTFLQLLIEEQPQGNRAVNTPAVRPRVILQADPAAPATPEGWQPQRLEVTVSRSPVPAIVGSQYGSWLVENDRANSLDFSSTNLSSGAIRGVYELRPAGTRELILVNLGLADADPTLARRMEVDPPPGWTLWWRPILQTELAELESGVPPRADLDGNPEAIRTRLAGAIAVLSGINSLRWQIFKSDERVSEFAAAGIPDLPAFAELEVVLLNGRYASWMFEIGWTTGEDPSVSGGNGEASADADGANPVPNGGGGGGGNGAGGNRPGTREPSQPVRIRVGNERE